MKKQILLICSIVALAVPAFAGTATASKEYVAPHEAPVGGPYIAIFGGANFPEDNHSVDVAGLHLDENNDTGWFAGLKAGYVFPVNFVLKPALEIEGFYNRLDLGADGRYLGHDVSVGMDVDSGVALANAILKAEFGPVAIYGGAGIGYYYASPDNAEIHVAGHTFTADQGDDQDGFAWQALGGVEFMFHEHWSVFAEYKFLVYRDAFGDDLNQHLVGGGLKFRF